MVRLHLWKIGFAAHGWIKVKLPGFPRVLTALSPKTFGKFHNFLINFVVGIISWKYEACIWWVEIYSEMGPICLVPGPNSTKFRRAYRMGFSPLANRNMFGGSSTLRKMGWNYPFTQLQITISIYFIENKGLEFSSIVGLFLGVIF